MAKIVIIEDNTPNLSLMSYLLSASGHEVEGIRDGETGLKRVLQGGLDLVLCDIQLPRLSGELIIQALRSNQATRNLPVVAVTAMAMRGDRERAQELGFSGYIEKPIEPQLFVAQVEGHLKAELRKGAQPAKPRDAAAHTQKPSAASLGVTALVVDDIPANQHLLESILSSRGFRVVTARNIQSAMSILKSEQINIVLSDVHMLSGDGFRLRREMLAVPSLQAIPFILMSSERLSGADRVEAEQLGVARILERPVEPEDLAQLVLDTLQAAGKRV